MFFSHDRNELRQFFFNTWQKKQSGKPMEPLEEMIASVIEVHPEYHAMLKNEDANIDKDFTPEQGESNPFLHLGLHIAIQEQLSTQRPAGIVEVYKSLMGKLQDAHKVEHSMMECLAEMVWSAQRNNTVPDEKVYLGNLQNLVKKLGA